MKTKVVLDNPFLEKEFIEKIKKIKNIDLKIYDDFAFDEKQQLERIQEAEILVIDIVIKYSWVLLSKCKNLKVLITSSIWTDHIDLDYCKKRWIKVINFPDYHSVSVAEMWFAQLFTLLRKTNTANQHVKAGWWDYSLFEWNELKWKNLWIIWAWNIWKEIIKIWQGFGCNIFCNTLRPNKKRALEIKIEKFYELNEVLKNSDFLFIAIPATKRTENLINKKTLDLMKKSAYLINIARPQIVNTLDLAESIYNKCIAWVWLDIIEKEPFDVRKSDILIQEMVNSNNVLVTPHIAMMTREAIEKLGNSLILELEENLEKKG